ncbi:MAG: Rne/Rng family ribonuclease [Bacillota bacterium]|jgi:ribonuclease G
MYREILIKVDPDEISVVVLENQHLSEIYIERISGGRLVGNIYKGYVENVLPGMQAAFVDIGMEKNSFLYVEDAAPKKFNEFGDAQSSEKTKKSISQLLHKGQELVVQIFKEPTGTKGARVTTHPTFPGRYLVLLPTSNYVAVSRRIREEEERKRLKELVSALLPQGMGAIIRTAAKDMGEEQLLGDIKMLSKQWKRIQGKSLKAPAPSLLYSDLGLVERVIRDTDVTSVERILVDNKDIFEKMVDIASVTSPSLVPKIFLRQSEDLFKLYNVQDQMDQALRRKVWLKSGGYIIIDQVEALSVIDVNTGKYVGEDDLSQTILRTNLEAAAEIARQLRLRNLGGIIIVDFIDMDNHQDKAHLLSVLEEEVKKDRTRVTILGMTHLGLVEMTRKKIGQGLSASLEKECPFCNGRGRVLSEETVALRLKREIEALAKETEAPAIFIEANTSVASFLIGSMSKTLHKIERKYKKKLIIKGNFALHMEEILVRPCYETDEESFIQSPLKPGQRLKVKIESQHKDRLNIGSAKVNGFLIHVEDAGSKVGQEVEIEITRIMKTHAKAQVIEDNLKIYKY